MITFIISDNLEKDFDLYFGGIPALPSKAGLSPGPAPGGN
jgi:hypothetical protein